MPLSKVALTHFYIEQDCLWATFANLNFRPFFSSQRLRFPSSFLYRRGMYFRPFLPLRHDRLFRRSSPSIFRDNLEQFCEISVNCGCSVWLVSARFLALGRDFGLNFGLGRADLMGNGHFFA